MPLNNCCLYLDIPDAKHSVDSLFSIKAYIIKSRECVLQKLRQSPGLFQRPRT